MILLITLKTLRKKLIMTEALKHLASLKTGQWHNLNDIPKELFDDAWKIIDEELLDGYRFTLHEVYNYLVMKTKRADKEMVAGIVAQIRRDYDRISWLWCVFSEEKYMLEVSITTVNKFVATTSDNIFMPFYGKPLNDGDLLSFLYKHCTNIKIGYIKEEPKDV